MVGGTEVSIRAVVELAFVILLRVLHQSLLPRELLEAEFADSPAQRSVQLDVDSEGLLVVFQTGLTEGTLIVPPRRHYFLAFSQSFRSFEIKVCIGVRLGLFGSLKIFLFV